jgi:threonine dehydrogenase-like Zn-dependent dehydrogenase
VVARARGEPVTVETTVVPDTGPGEAVVAIHACGVCHTDLHYRETGINDEPPSLLAAGQCTKVDPVEKIQELTDGFGVDVAIDGPGATGRSFSSYDVILDPVEHRRPMVRHPSVTHPWEASDTSLVYFHRVPVVILNGGEVHPSRRAASSSAGTSTVMV